jgi:Na+-transporting methylmalonyl-CoA/oxaloacetate decarboxylase gamma subunit
MNGIGMSIVFFIISLLILFVVIETAVRNGINSSIIGKYLESKSEVKEDKKSFLSDDLDN